jgi:membrane protein DedA with SNARE-associated domain
VTFSRESLVPIEPATAVTLLGLFVGNHVETIDRILSSIGWVGLAVVAVIVGPWFWRHRSRPTSG